LGGQWYQQPDFDVFAPYFERRKLYPEQAFYLLDPRSQWTLWDYIQSLIPVRIRKNPPSSGFLGKVLNYLHCMSVTLTCTSGVEKGTSYVIMIDTVAYRREYVTVLDW
jgi:hypothetical protein